MPEAIGTASITVTVDDGQSANHTVSRSFKVTVFGPNTAPSFVVGPFGITPDLRPCGGEVSLIFQSRFIAA
jgi:hypothetical protein